MICAAGKDPKSDSARGFVEGWIWTNGELISTFQNTALFQLIGVEFGGNGRTNFAVPTVISATPGVLVAIDVQGTYPQPR